MDSSVKDVLKKIFSVSCLLAGLIFLVPTMQILFFPELLLNLDNYKVIIPVEIMMLLISPILILFFYLTSGFTYSKKKYVKGDTVIKRRLRKIVNTFVILSLCFLYIFLVARLIRATKDEPLFLNKDNCYTYYTHSRRGNYYYVLVEGHRYSTNPESFDKLNEGHLVEQGNEYSCKLNATLVVISSLNAVIDVK